MSGFFRHPTGRAFKQNILVLIKATPNSIFGYAHFRSFSSVAKRGVRTKPELIRNEALRKYGLSNLDLIWPRSASSSEDVNYIERNPGSIKRMYGESDLSKLPIFQGGFINFGYWPNPFFESGHITAEQRIACSKEMYRMVGDLVHILKQYSVLDVGCGLGYGSSFFSQYYEPKLVVGVDISPHQIARAKKCQVSGIKSGKLRFTIGEAESMPFTDNSFDCIVSVEAAQHFTSMRDFSEEVSRVLKPGGKLVMTSFFPKSKEGVNALNAIIPNYHIHGSQNTMYEVEEALSKHMESVKMHSIGENVWHGFSKWLDQIGYHNQWSKIWSALYEKGLIDYVVYQANSPKMERSQLLEQTKLTP